jgi:hypothetical protein
MQLLIRTLLMMVISVFCFSGLYAANASIRPVSRLPKDFFSAVKNLSLHFHSTNHPVMQGSVVKICSCQILNLQSNNYHQNDMGVFAERSSKGHLSTDLSITKKIIDKEKKHIRLLFYDKLKVVDSFSETTDCKSLYLKLKLKNSSLVIYDILNADLGK